MVLDGLVALLGTQPDFRVIGAANSGQEVLRALQDEPPDVLLLDLAMPDMDGVEVLRTARELIPDLKVIIFTAFDTDERIVGALQAGAQGYLLKDSRRDELFRAVRVVSTGGSLLQPVVASKFLRSLRDNRTDRGVVDQLTAREHDVLGLMAQGKTNQEIATELVITERTVKFHVSSILSKLDASNRTEAVSIAAQQGLIEL